MVRREAALGWGIREDIWEEVTEQRTTGASPDQRSCGRQRHSQYRHEEEVREQEPQVQRP